jgi:uncharacterized protein YndB with AHSA1/START domain
MSNGGHPENAGRSITITRQLAAPRALVFAACTAAEHLKEWYRASDDWTTPFAESDPRPGGALRVGFGSPDGRNDFVLEAVYDEIAPPERLSYTMADGRRVVMTFAEQDGGTFVSLTLDLESTFSEDMQRGGWSAMLANLERHLAA